MRFALPFPPASLAGHNNGHWRSRDREVASIRAEAFHLTRAAKGAQRYQVPATGDICIHLHFVPPNDRGDRVNYPIRIKAQLDGIAEALGVNDKRFLPIYTFAKPEKAGRVVVEFIPIIEGEQAENALPKLIESVKESADRKSVCRALPALNNNARSRADV